MDWGKYRFRSINAAISLLIVAGCSLEQAENRNSQLKVSFGSGTSSLSEVFSGPSLLSTPPSTFSCYFVNVIGPGIGSNGSTDAPVQDFGPIYQGNSCSYAGILSPPLSATAGVSKSISLSVPSGPGRVVQMVGVDSSTPGICSAGPGTGLSASSSDVYELGRSVVDLYSDTSVTLSNSYNSLSTALKTARKMNCKSSGGSAYRAAILATSGLLGYWRFNELSGTQAFDEVAESYNGTYSGGQTFGITGPISSESNTAVQFIAANSHYATLPANNFGASATAATMSVEFWVKSPACAANKYIFKMYSGANTEFSVRCDASFLRADVYSSTGNNGLAQVANTSVTGGGWHHVAAVKTSSNVILYVDGSVADTSGAYAPTGDLDMSAGTTFIAKLPSPLTYMSVFVDEVAIYNSALSAAQVNDHYNKGL